MKYKRLLVILSVAVAIGIGSIATITRTQNQDGSVVVEDSSVSLKMTFTASDIKLDTDGGGNQVIAFPWDHTVSTKVEVTDTNATIDWAFLYYGDGGGTFATQNGQVIDHSYTGKSRYNPTLIAKVNGSIVYLTDKLHSVVAVQCPTGDISMPLPSYTPTHTINSALNTVLDGLAIDNSTLDWGCGGLAKCICGKTTTNCKSTEIDIHECSLTNA